MKKKGSSFALLPYSYIERISEVVGYPAEL